MGKVEKNYVYVTLEGLQKLEQELKFLREERRVEIAEKLKEAISFGDLSENAEYEEARNDQAQVELRISELEDQLKNVKIIKEEKSTKENRVIIGKEVTILNLESDEEGAYKIVGTTESSILAEIPKISNDSPIGKALLGKNIGDVVKVKSYAGTTEYKIVSIK
ncbi:MAG: transcription elongation factor GreA [Candidatus Gracilibacteria bacterium]|nr:transcription elongation factor GreA [Candidatus Gracilibacteria bacterium]